MKNDWLRGMRDGLPIGLGYFSVSFGIGILAVQSGLPAWSAVVISLTNLTSAGEAAGIGVIAAAGSYIELILTQLLINCRYFLMAISLSQNLSPEFTFGKRLIAAYGITDEIFGVCSAQKEPLRPAYMLGCIFVSTVGWTMGTLLGAVTGEIFPAVVTGALGILLYGMFIAIIVPPARDNRADLFAVLVAAFISCIIYYCIPAISGGFSIIISAVLAAALMAVLFPLPEEKNTEDAQ